MHYRSILNTQAKRNLELARCIQDPVYWCNTWVWTFAPKDPVEEQSWLPFELFPKQEEFIRWLETAEKRRGDHIVEKSRDVGVSWLCCVFAAHRFLFRSGYTAGFGSNLLENVDKLGDNNSLFEKIRTIFQNLPDWMLPKVSEREVSRKKGKIGESKLKLLVNHANGSTITGTGGKNFGRSGRASIFFVDEAAFLEHPQAVDNALEGLTRCRVDVSTPNGAGNPFAQKRFSERFRDRVFTFHWSDDPRKTPEWAEQRKAEVDEVTWASQYEIDYAASIAGIAIPAKWVRAAVNLLHPAHATGPILAGFDVAEEGKDFCVVIIRRGPIVSEVIHSWGGVNPTESAGRARRIAEEAKVEQLAYDALSVGAGITGPWQTAEIPLKFSATGVKAGGTPTEDYWPDGTTSKDKFKNLRAEMWWKLRSRFEKAWEYKEKGVQHPVSEMISIPNHPQLIAELSAPLAQHTETGKIQIESKEKMRSRGIKSPDFADALALAFFATGDRWQFTSRIPKSLMESAPRGTWIDEGEEDMTSRIERLGW